MLSDNRKHDFIVTCKTAFTMSTYQERLAQAMRESELYRTPTELAKAIGCTSQAISQALSGASKKLGAENHSKAADLLSVREIWLASGDGPMRRPRSAIMDPAHRAKNKDAVSNITEYHPPRGTVPIISFVQAGDFTEAIDNLMPGEGEQIPVTVPVHNHTFALRVQGDSMEPDFPEGIIIVVEPEMGAQPGDYVVAKNGDDATFKQLVKDGPDWYLKPLNPRYPVKPLGESRIIGVVREAIRKLR